MTGNDPKKVTQMEGVLQWFKANRSFYEALTSAIASMLPLFLREVRYHSILHRTKSLDSLRLKLQAKDYADPTHNITDFSAVRVVCYVLSEAKRVEEIIRQCFDIDEKRSDLSDTERGSPKEVGYWGRNIVAKLPDNLTTMPGFNKFEGLWFEVQVHTILAHAWAEIEHDSYKYGELPDALRRRFTDLGGTLRQADRELNALAADQDDYLRELKAPLGRRELSKPLTITSLTEFLRSRFPRLVEAGWTPDFLSLDHRRRLGIFVIEHLAKMGITTVPEFAAIIPDSFEEMELQYLQSSLPHWRPNFTLLVTDLVALYNADLLYETNPHLTLIPRRICEFLRRSGQNVTELIERHGLSID